jgi:ribosomal-protein-alanine N-acetyltransferase
VSEEVVVPELETERLVLRGLGEEDIPWLFEHFGKSEVNEHVQDDDVKSMEEARELYEAYIRPRPHLFRLGMTLKESGQLVGTIGFYDISKEHKRAILGVDLDPAHWGKGLATEAVLALVRYGFEEMGLNRIEASADPENGHSIRLIERTGFVKEGVKRQLDWYKGTFHDDVIYSVLRDDWTKRGG